MLSQERIKGCTRRILSSRMRILNSHGFFGLLLMHMNFALEEKIETAATDGQRIIFSPDFMDELSDNELDFVLMHEILHVALQHCFRGENYDRELFNIACDIVVNSNILKEKNMDRSAITLKKFGEAMHLTPSGEEGFNFTAEEVYHKLKDKSKKTAEGRSSYGNGKESHAEKSGASFDNIHKEKSWDDHSKWGAFQDSDGSLGDIWVRRVEEASSAINIINSARGRGTVPLCISRLLKDLREPKLDWRTLLNNFIHTEICDYSFAPPDKRYDDTGFYLPDYNENDERVENILFMIDTSASMSDEDVTEAYSEIKGAIDQFNGRLSGWLGFFDAEIVEPVPFVTTEDFKCINPSGGGGTRFDIIFDYAKKCNAEKRPDAIVILTDGFAPFPDESEADDIPVLWVLNNDKAEAPFGKVARIKGKE